ncbi:hypothetical protein ABVT39_022502 [Epinephelus coioides]
MEGDAFVTECFLESCHGPVGNFGRGPAFGRPCRSVVMLGSPSGRATSVFTVMVGGLKYSGRYRSGNMASSSSSDEENTPENPEKGSSRIVSLLNKLGHCVSWDTIMCLDTSLAQLTLVEGRDKIPKGFSKTAPTTLVWDNIDFGEETLSGCGTTHHTNGIMLQSFAIEPVSTTIRQALKKGVSSFKALPQIPVEPYNQSKRQGPQNLHQPLQILLLFVRATRESNRQLHLSTVHLMMPWFFAYDRINYVRYLPSYWLEMVNLPITHPSCHSELSVKGQWTVQRQSEHGFASIACDQAIEQTCNRDAKTKGGWTRITQYRAAVCRWMLSQHERAAIARQSSADGSLAKTNKSALMDLLESKGGDYLIDKVPTDGAILFDGMAVIQALQSRPSTFGELAETILQHIIQLALQHKCTRIDFVIDQYPKMSIKNLERSCRAEGGTQWMQIYGQDQKTPT